MGRIEKVKDDVVLEEGAQLVISGKEVEVVFLFHAINNLITGDNESMLITLVFNQLSFCNNHE
jgi:hypothetical protein